MIPNATLLYSKTVSAINIPLHMYRFLNVLSTTLYVRNLKDTRIGLTILNIIKSP